MLSRTDKERTARCLAAAICDYIEHDTSGRGPHRVTLTALRRHGAPREHYSAIVLRNCPVMVTQGILSELHERTGEPEYAQADAEELVDAWKYSTTDGNGKRLKQATLTIHHWPITEAEVARG